MFKYTVSVCTAIVVSQYQKKKKYIYASRKRKSIKKTIEKLISLMKEVPKKDLEKLSHELNQISITRYDELGHFNSLDDELADWRERKILEDVKKGNLVFAERLKPYICKVCYQKGYIYSADFEKQDLYMVHIRMENEELKTSTCHLGEIKRPLIAIDSVASEGILSPYIVERKRPAQE